MVSVLVVVLPTVVLVMVARPPRLVPLTSVVPFFFHTEVNGVLPASVVVKVAVVPWATCWLVMGVLTTGGTQSCAVSVLVLTVAKFVPDTLPVFETEDAVDGLVSGLLTVTWNLTITLLFAGSVPMLTFTGGTKNMAGDIAARAMALRGFAPRYTACINTADYLHCGCTPHTSYADSITAPSPLRVLPVRLALRHATGLTLG